MEEAQFRQIVAASLKNLLRQLDALPEADDMDSRISDGVLQVDFEAGGTFVLSQQVPTRELWLSAQRRAWHFRLVADGWTERDNGERLEATLSSLFSTVLRSPVVIKNPRA